ncbi:MAG: YdiU family protein [Acidimicrobiales bacterium]|nr:YdiU family protein [Acidimicrobiales bacterium]
MFEFDNSYRRDLAELGIEWKAAPAPEPRLVVLNDALAVELGVDPALLRSDEGVAVLAGNAEAAGSEPIAMAYAGHQFGGYSPRLGDGRALLLGEVVDASGQRRDVHLKGSGRTPFARGGDGKAVLGPMLREYLFAEAMHALGVPTTRALAVVTTGEQVFRDGAEPGAVLTRVASSHLRVGTFEYAARLDDSSLVRRLADHAIARHHPEAAGAERPYLAFFEAVLEAQAALVARWMLVGFIHGVMNTDNTTISGETIDYGPCAFMDRFDPATVFSSIDHGGRYAYANQPPVVQWNLARLAETLLPLIDEDLQVASDLAMEVLISFPDRYERHWAAGMAAKLGLAGLDPDPSDAELFADLLALLHEGRVDHTSAFRALADERRGDEAPVRRLLAEAPAGAALDAWLSRWRSRVATGGRDLHAVADAMDAVNPCYIPRNHLVDQALAAATAGDLAPFEALLARVTDPFVEHPGAEAYAQPAPDGFTEGFQTFCGT